MSAMERLFGPANPQTSVDQFSAAQTCMFASYDERSARSSFSSPCTCSRILATFSALVGDPVTGEVLASAAWFQQTLHQHRTSCRNALYLVGREGASTGFTVFRPSISYCISSMRACAPVARCLTSVEGRQAGRHPAKAKTTGHILRQLPLQRWFLVGDGGMLACGTEVGCAHILSGCLQLSDQHLPPISLSAPQTQLF